MITATVVAPGVCVRCDEPRVPGHRYCAKHLRQKSGHNSTRHRRHAAGLCIDCAAPMNGDKRQRGDACQGRNCPKPTREMKRARRDEELARLAEVPMSEQKCPRCSLRGDHVCLPTAAEVAAMRHGSATGSL